MLALPNVKVLSELFVVIYKHTHGNKEGIKENVLGLKTSQQGRESLNLEENLCIYEEDNKEIYSCPSKKKRKKLQSSVR